MTSGSVIEKWKCGQILTVAHLKKKTLSKLSAMNSLLCSSRWFLWKWRNYIWRHVLCWKPFSKDFCFLTRVNGLAYTSIYLSSCATHVLSVKILSLSRMAPLTFPTSAQIADVMRMVEFARLLVCWSFFRRSSENDISSLPMWERNC